MNIMPCQLCLKEKDDLSKNGEEFIEHSVGLVVECLICGACGPSRSEESYQAACALYHATSVNWISPLNQWRKSHGGYDPTKVSAIEKWNHMQAMIARGMLLDETEVNKSKRRL